MQVTTIEYKRRKEKGKQNKKNWQKITDHLARMIQKLDPIQFGENDPIQFQHKPKSPKNLNWWYKICYRCSWNANLRQMSWLEAAGEAVDEASRKRRQRSEVRGSMAVEGKRESVRETRQGRERERERAWERLLKMLKKGEKMELKNWPGWISPEKIP